MKRFITLLFAAIITTTTLFAQKTNDDLREATGGLLSVNNSLNALYWAKEKDGGVDPTIKEKIYHINGIVLTCREKIAAMSHDVNSLNDDKKTTVVTLVNTLKSQTGNIDKIEHKDEILDTLKNAEVTAKKIAAVVGVKTKKLKE